MPENALSPTTLRREQQLASSSSLGSTVAKQVAQIVKPVSKSDKLQVKYFGSFATRYGFDERAFADPMAQLQVKLTSNPDACSVVELSFTSNSIVLEDRSGSMQSLPAQMLSFADRTKNINFFAIVMISPDRTYFICHLLSSYRAPLAATMDFIAEGIRRVTHKEQ